MYYQDILSHIVGNASQSRYQKTKCFKMEILKTPNFQGVTLHKRNQLGRFSFRINDINTYHFDTDEITIKNEKAVRTNDDCLLLISGHNKLKFPCKYISSIYFYYKEITIGGN